MYHTIEHSFPDPEEDDSIEAEPEDMESFIGKTFQNKLNFNKIDVDEFEINDLKWKKTSDTFLGLLCFTAASIVSRD